MTINEVVSTLAAYILIVVALCGLSHSFTRRRGE